MYELHGVPLPAGLRGLGTLYLSEGTAWRQERLWMDVDGYTLAVKFFVLLRMCVLFARASHSSLPSRIQRLASCAV